MIEKIVIGIAVLLLIAFVASGCIQDVLVPGYIEPEAREFVGGYEPVNGLYTSLFDIERIEYKVNHKAELNNEELVNAIDHNSLVHKYLIQGVSFSKANATELKESVFSPGSPIATLLTGIPLLTVGWLGLSKPSDKKKLNGGK